MWFKKKLIVVGLMVLVSSGVFSAQIRIKDVTRLQGTGENQLIGYGLVVGLAGTGDTKNAYSTIQSVANMLKNFGVQVTPDQINKIKNVAAVMVSASLPSFTRSGDKIDIVVSSIGDATSLEGGILLLTPLLGVDGNVYATAQGTVSIGGFNVKGGRQVQAQRNHSLVGRIISGALIAKNFSVPILREDAINFILDKPDFTNALNISTVINDNFKMNLAKARDASWVEVKVPESWKENLVEIISVIEDLKIEPDGRATIVINERTGTVIIGKSVKVQPVAITHSNISLTIKDKKSEEIERRTAVRSLQEKENKQYVVSLERGNTIEDIVKALNAIGITPRDLIAILQAMNEAGAILAEIKII